MPQKAIFQAKMIFIVSQGTQLEIILSLIEILLLFFVCFPRFQATQSADLSSAEAG